jgi:hypothetical protein
MDRCWCPTECCSASDPNEGEQIVAELAQRVSQACPPRFIGGELVELLRGCRVLVVEHRGLS